MYHDIHMHHSFICAMTYPRLRFIYHYYNHHRCRYYHLHRRRCHYTPNIWIPPLKILYIGGLIVESY